MALAHTSAVTEGMRTLFLDLRRAARGLLRAPSVAIAALLSIGIATGATTAVFSWMDGLVLHPFPSVADQQRLVGLEVGPPNGGMGAWSYQTFKELRDGTHSFTGMAAWRIVRVSAREAGETGSVPALATTVSGQYFDVLGVRPAIGRLIDEHDIDGRAPVAVLGHQYWIDRYHGDPSVLGRTILLNGQGLSVIGVAPPRFSGVYTGVVPHFYVPLTLQPTLSGVNTLDDRKLRSWLLFARLLPGASIDAARSDADVVARRIATSYGDRPAPGAEVMFLRVEFLGATLSPLFVAMLAVSMLLVVLASANVAGLLLVRSDARRGEFALRRALGATKWNVSKLALVESVLLAVGGGLIGLATAYGTRGMLYAFIPRGAFPISLPIAISWRVFATALTLCAAVTVGCGLAPAWSAANAPAGDALRSWRTATGRSSRLRAAIVSGQLALCVVSLVLAGMFARGLARASAIDLGFSDPAHVLLVDTDFGAPRLTGANGVAAFAELMKRLRALPGVRSATAASMVPLGFGGRRIVEMKVEGRATAPNENMSAERAHVGPDYATTMRIRIVRGREITDGDRDGTLPVAMVNEAFVNRFLPGVDPIGHRIDAGQGWATIVGVVHDGKYDRLDEPLHPVVYVPLAQWFVPSMTLHVRSDGSVGALGEPVRRALLAVNVDLPALQARSLAEHISASTFVPRTGAIVIGTFAGLATILSVVGLYAALAFSVALRRRELSIKRALGARRREIAWTVAHQALRIAVTGIVVGLVLAVVGSRVLRAEVASVAPSDAVTVIVAASVLLLAAAVGAWAPARQAARVDPAAVLRGD